MKIFEFKFSGGEIDWVFDESKKDAKETYLRINGFNISDLDKCKISNVPKNKWKELFLLDPNELEPDPDDVEYNEDDYYCRLKIIESFAEYAARNNQPYIIATTEF